MATATAQYPSGYNTYVANHQATNNLIIDFARNIEDFSCNKYCQTIKVETNVGLYMRMTLEAAARFIDSHDSVWADASERPLGWHNYESFVHETYRTIRRTFPVTLGYLTTEQSSWDLFAQYQSLLGRQAMTARTAAVVNALTDVSAYDSTHVFDVKASYGGGWDVSITANNSIKKTIYDAVNLILQDTLGAVTQKDLVMVISPEAAAEIMVSQEITDYIKGSPDAWGMTKGTLESNPYGMPPTLYGMPVIVENSVKVVSKKGEPRETEWIFPKDTAVICSRPGGITAPQGPSFSTVCLFAKEEMTAERLDDPKNRRTVLAVTEDYCAMNIAPVSGVLLTNLLSTSTST